MTNYSECRKRGIDWINSKDRNFIQGLSILQDSGYKPVAVANVAKRGPENDFARAKLEALIYELVRLWAKPGMADIDEKPEPVITDTPAPKNETEVNALCDKNGYPFAVRRAIHEFYVLMEMRRIAHKKACDIQGNDEQSVLTRNELLTQVEDMSERMDILWAAKTAFEQDKTMPAEDMFNPEKKEKSNSDDEDQVSIPDDATAEELKKLKKNINTKLIRSKNMLEFQQVTKADEPNPLPEGPKKVKYEKKVAEYSALIEQISYKIVALS